MTSHAAKNIECLANNLQKIISGKLSLNDCKFHCNNEYLSRVDVCMKGNACPSLVLETMINCHIINGKRVEAEKALRQYKAYIDETLTKMKKHPELYSSAIFEDEHILEESQLNEENVRLNETYWNLQKQIFEIIVSKL